MDPGTLPGPPRELKKSSITVKEFGDSMFRSHGIHRGPVFFGKSGAHRFDAPDQSFGVLYAGRDPFSAFVETFTRAAGTRVITTTALERQALSELKAERPLRLIDLTQSGALVRIGADARLFSADHEAAQKWSKFLHDHFLRLDGILYPSRLDPEKHGIALFEDRAPAILNLSRESWYAPGPMRRLLAELMEHYELELIENRFVAPRKPAASARQQRLFPDS
jgi:hypothetical protein